MSEEVDKDSVLGLFSTRATEGRFSGTVATPARGGRATLGAGGSGAVVKSGSAGSRPTVGSSSSSTSNRAASGNASRGELSPLASTVMREARRELGSNYNLQQAADAAVDID